MPYILDYRPAEVFMTHKNIVNYHVYKDDDIDQGCRELWFDTKEDSRDEDGFNVSDLANRLGVELVTSDTVTSLTDEQTMRIIRLAIDSGLLQSQQNG